MGQDTPPKKGFARLWAWVWAPAKKGEVRNAWLVAIVLFFLLLLGARLAENFLQPTGEPSVASDRPTALAEWTQEGVHVYGWADEREVHAGDEVTLWLFVENQGQRAVSGLEMIETVAPGFEPSGGCWQRGCRFPHCVPLCRVGEASAARERDGLPHALAPGRTAGVRGKLRARSVAGGESATLRLRWQSGGSRRLERSLSIGPFWGAHAPSRGAAPGGWPFVVARSVYEFFKDLGLPIVVVLLGFLLQRSQSDRERKERREEDSRRVRNSLLHQAHKNVVQYLMPISSSASMTVSQVKRCGALTTPPANETAEEGRARQAKKRLALRRAFYYLIKTLKQNVLLVDQGGGYLFKTRKAEAQAVNCWDEFFGRTVEELRYPGLYTLLDGFQEGDTLTRFERRFCRDHCASLGLEQPDRTPEFSPVFQEVRASFEGWIESQEFQRLVRPRLAAFGLIVLMEINALYSEWYRRPDEETVRTLESELKTWRFDGGGEGSDGVRKEDLEKLRQLRNQICELYGIPEIPEGQSQATATGADDAAGEEATGQGGKGVAP